MLPSTPKIRTVRRKRTSTRTVWGCPKTKNRCSWCYAICTPKDGIGDCGRPAGHAMLSRTQLAILKEQARRKANDDN